LSSFFNIFSTKSLKSFLMNPFDFTMNMKILSNTAIGTHEDCITKCAKVPLKPSQLVVLDPTDPKGVNLSSGDSIPFGVTSDEATAGEIVNVDLLGCSNTLHIRAGTNVPAGALLIPGPNGTVLPMPTGAGTYSCIGLALSSDANGTEVYQHKITTA
jgi:hypothetical protein